MCPDDKNLTDQPDSPSVGEKSFQRLKRELRMLTACHHVLVRAADEKSLLDRICQIACVEGGYRMAWVGFVEDELQQTVRIAAKWGADDGYLDVALIDWSDAERGHGPARSAVRSGKAAIVHDFAADSDAPPWRIQASSREFRSCIALPLLDDSTRIFGIFVIYAAEPNCFMPDEVRLLEELSGDLSFGITSLRARVAYARSEAALRESELSYRNQFTKNSAAMMLIDYANGSILDANDAAVRFYGYPREKLLSLRITDINTQAPVVTKADWESVTQDKGRNFEFQHRLADGSLRSVEVSSSQIQFGERRVLHSIIRDISVRKQAEQALRESEARLKEAQRVAHVGNWELDLLTDTLTWSDEIYRIFEIKREGFGATYAAFIALIHPEDRGFVNAAYRQSLENHAPYGVTHRLLLPDGRIKYVQEQCESYWSPEGQPIRSVGTVQEITEQKRLEEQARQSQKMEAVGQLAGGVAHDFNNILLVFMMQLDLLRMSTSANEEILQGLNDLDLAAQRAAGLTRQLLMFSRRSVLEIQELDLNDVITNLLKMLGRLLGESITLVSERKTLLPLVDADAGMLEQVLMNLAVNARDAMPHGGRITLATEAVVVDGIVPGNPDQRPGRFVRLSVSDTGFGMDAATLKQVFEPFFTTKAAGKGTGLGLSTVYGIVAQHRGWVDVESKVGEGTTFRIYLPESTQSPKKIADSGSSEIPRGQETLLVVEDDRLVRQMLVMNLRNLGYHVLEATNGQEAMIVWRNHGHQIDLLLTDMVMPEGITGLALAERLREEKPALKVIVSSGYSAEMSARGKSAGIHYLPKPYQVSTLGKTVRDCLGD